MFRSSELFPILAASLFGLGVVACECPGSYTEVGGSCFLLLKDVRGDFLKARDTCKLYNGDLAIIKDCALLGAVAKYVESQGANDTCPSPYVSVGGSCLNFLSTLDMTWDDARVVCQINGGDLAIIDDCHLMSAVISYARQHGNGGDLAIIDDCHLMSAVISYARQHGLVPVKGFWIGGSDAATEGVWTWIDGSAMAKGVPFWGRSGSGSLQPDNSGNEDCLVLVHSDQYYFNDLPCSNEESSAPLCQADPI